MDRTEAAALLGLSAAGFTLGDLRSARNASLKAHHPDKAGSDSAAVRRATYWTSRINEAYAVLEPFAVRPTATSEHAPPRQSFTAASHAAAARAQANPRSPIPAGGSRPGQTARLPPRRPLARKAQQDTRPPPNAPDGTTTPPTPPGSIPPRDDSTRRATSSTPPRAAQSAPRSRRRGMWPYFAASGLILLIGVPLGLSQATGGTQAAGPTPTREAQATQSSSRTAAPTSSPATEADNYYDWLFAADLNHLRPCFGGGIGCEPERSIDIGDGTDAKLATEIDRVFTMFKDEGSPQFSKVICREERGTLFAPHVPES